MVGVSFRGRDCPFKVNGGCKLDSCLFGIKRVIKDVSADADILFWVTHVTNCVMQCCMFDVAYVVSGSYDVDLEVICKGEDPHFEVCLR